DVIIITPYLGRRRATHTYQRNQRFGQARYNQRVNIRFDCRKRQPTDLRIPFMQFDVTILPSNLNETSDMARQAELYGFNGLWTTETAHNPFLPLPLAAAVTERLELGTAIAVAFPRSPMVTAQIAWDLAAQSKGRFLLGL